MNSVLATMKRNFISQIRAYPIGFFLGNITTCFFIVMGSFFVYSIVFEKNVSADFIAYSNTSDYMSYVILGSLIYMFVVRTFLNVSRSFITEMREGTIDSLLIAPLNHIGYLCGNMLEQIITTTMEVLAALIISLPFGLKFQSVNITSALVCIIISLLSFFGMSVILCGIMVYLRDTYISQNTVFAIINLLCGIAFPIQYLPKWAQNISNLIPVTYSLKIMRNSVLSGMSIFNQRQDFIILLLQGVCYCIVGILLLKIIIKKVPERQFI